VSGGNPWDKRESETAKAYAAFRIFRDLDPGKRSIRAACAVGAGVVNPSPSRVKSWQQWHKRYDWAERAQAWDAHLDEIRQESAEDAIEQMQRDHIEAAQQLRHFAMISLRRLIERAEADPGYALPPVTVGRLLREATTLERVSCGMPTAIERQETGEDGEQVIEVFWAHELPDVEDDEDCSEDVDDEDPNEGNDK